MIAWIVNMARRLGRFVAQAGVPNDPNERLRLAARAAVTAARALRGTITAPILQAALAVIRVRYGLNAIEPFESAGRWWVRAVINPTLVQDLGVATDAAPTAGAASASKTQAITALNAITSASQVSPAMVDLEADEAEILARFKGADDGYLLYLNGKNVGETFDLPLPYLRRRAAFKKGKAIEAFWIRKVLSAGKNNRVYRVKVGSAWERVIPDVVTDSVVGDAKDWKDISFTAQLRAFHAIAKASTRIGEVEDADGHPVNWTRSFVIIVRSKSHSEGKTTVSGPLVGAADQIHYRITDKDVK